MASSSVPLSKSGKRMPRSEINVALLGATPPTSGGIASWTDRMIHSEFFSGEKLFLVDERVDGGREVFGGESGVKLLVEARRCLRIWRDLIACIKDSDIDVVHSNTPATATSLLREIICASIARLHKCKVVGHFHCTVANMVKSPVHEIILKAYLHLCDAAIVLNRQSSSYLERLSESPIYLIPNFISEKEIQGARFDRPAHRAIRKILYVGGIIESKGVFDVVRIAGNHPEIEFRFAGAGELPADIHATENVCMLGTLDHDELAEEYSTCDLFMFLTRFPSEGFSCALLEAMTFGMPCIVTDWAANADMVGPDSGCVVPCGDLDSVEEVLSKLSDPIVRERIGKRNARTVRKLYGESVVVKEVAAVYRSVSG